MAVASISKFAERDEWRERLDSVTSNHIDPVLEAFDVDDDALPEVLGATGFFRLADFVLEDFLTREFAPDAKNVVDDYLARRGWRESGPGKQYLHAIRRSVVSLYEVTGTVPGSHFLAKDLVRGGAPVAVVDKLGSQSVVKWDRIAARLLPLGGQIGMSGGALPIHFEDTGRLLERLASMRTRLESALPGLGIVPEQPQSGFDAASFDRALLASAAPLFTTVWLSGILHRRSSAARPRLINTDGDEFLFSTTRFPLVDAGHAGEIEKRLDRIRAIYREDGPEPAWTWFNKSRPAPAKPDGGASKLMLISKDALHRTVLGSLRMESGALILETNSANRAERGRAMLGAALGNLVGSPLTAMKSVDRALEEHARAGNPKPEPAFSPEETEAILGDFMSQHYRQVLSLPLPMLDGKSPRQAARSKAGRQRVAEWLKYLENRSTREPENTGGIDFDFGWMWEELKIADLRQ
jgi:hypothetical protein